MWSQLKILSLYSSGLTSQKIIDQRVLLLQLLIINFIPEYFSYTY